MQQLSKRILFTLASTFTLSVLAVAPVWAEHGATTTSTDKTETETQVATTSDDSGTQSSETEKESTSGSLRVEAEKLLATKRATRKEHTATEKKTACEAHQTEINTRVNNYAAAGQRHLDVFNSIFTKVQAFHDSKQLNVPTYDSLVATAKTKQAAAQTAVDALKALDVKIDCSQPDPATSVATIKAATANARTALQDYRQAIKDVIVALKGASTSTSTTTTGGNQ